MMRIPMTGTSTPMARPINLLAVASAVCVLSACGGDGDPALPTPAQLGAAAPGTLANCATLTSFTFANTTITSATPVAAAAVTSTADGVSIPLPAHCVVLGVMNARTSAVDGKSYAINFEMRLPTAWNGRFFHQVNGGNDGDISTDTTKAYGRKLGASPSSNGLKEGFAVLSSDAGHKPDPAYPNDPTTGLGITGQAYGLDPQARRDYGYAAVGSLTPMAKALINAGYGRVPDRSYMVGCSNGGRHGLVAASRYANDYDGILAGDPGFNLPKASIAENWDSDALMAAAQSTDPVTARPAIWSALSAADMAYVNTRIIAKCDALDGVVDGMVQDVKACQAAFSLAGDVAACPAGTASNGTCLTTAQSTALSKIFAGPKSSSGAALYSDWPWANGINASGWRIWKMGVTNGAGTGLAKYGLNLALGSGSGAYLFSTPPSNPAVVTGRGATLIDWVLNYNFDQAATLINATTAVYTESAMTYMTPPNPSDLSTLRNRGAKLMVFHGSADPVFSYNDTISWYTALTGNSGGDATNFARVFTVPGMNHCSGGPTTDQFDMLTPLVNWVEKGQAPDAVVATAGTLAQNADLGATVLPGRTRPLCPYPKVARYNGSGGVEAAASFSCQ